MTTTDLPPRLLCRDCWKPFDAHPWHGCRVAREVRTADRRLPRRPPSTHQGDRMTCICCASQLDPRGFDPRRVCDRCLGYLLARVEHNHVRSPFDEALAAKCDPEHREETE